MAFTQLEVTSLYAATFEDSTMDANTLEGWMNNSAANLSELAAAMFAEADRYLTTLTTTEFVSALYEDVLGREAEAEGLAYWVNQIDTEAVSKDVMVLALIEGASSADDEAYVAAAAEDANNNVTGNTEMLTTAQDDIEGSVYADTFNAYIFDNANTAQSGDMISGGASDDTLYADIGDSQNFAITLHTDSVENFQVRAQTIADDANHNNMLNNAVQIDAERMDGTDRYESNNSRADVSIEDVRIENSQITEDIVIAMVQTDPGDVDFAVYFDVPSLRAAPEDTAGATLVLEIMDTRSMDAGLDPLLENPFDGFTFTVGGEVITIASEAIDAATTYAQLLTAVQDQVDANLELVDFTVALSGTFTAIDTDSGNPLTGQTLVITNNGDGVLGEGSWTTADGSVPAGGGLHRDQAVGEPDTSANLITSDIILDHVGRGSMGGDLLIGALSIGDSSDSTGVEQFDILVDRSSELEEISSTNNTLREVYIVNGDNTLNDVVGGQEGNLVVAGNDGAIEGATTVYNNDEGAIAGNANDDEYGFNDVRIVDASTMAGSITFDAMLSADVAAKYMNRTDDAENESTDNDYQIRDHTNGNAGFVYTLGTNNDTMRLDISSANLAAAGTTTREDFELAINGLDGDDTITTQIGDGTGVDASDWYTNSQDNANLAIDAGDGADTVATLGAGDFTINLGAGNDTAYADNSGRQTIAGAGEIGEQQTITVDATNDVVVAGTVVVGGEIISLADGADQDAVAAAIAAQIDGDTTANATEAVTAGSAGAVTTITYDTEDEDVAAIAVAAGSAVFGTLILDANVDAGVAQLFVDANDFTLDFTGMVAASNGIITIDGGNDVASAAISEGMTAQEIATAVGNAVEAVDFNGNGVGDVTLSAVTVAGLLTLDDATGHGYGNNAGVDAAVAIDTNAVNNVLATVNALDMVVADDARTFSDDNTEVNTNATWVFNASDVDINDLDGEALNTYFLPKATVTVTYSSGTTTAATAEGVTTGAAVQDSNGWESRTLDITTGYTATQAQLNQAIKDAINNDDVLNKLLVAQDGPGNTLIVTSIVDGEHAATDLQVDVVAATLATDFTAAETVLLQDAWEEFNNDSELVAIDQGDLNEQITVGGGTGLIDQHASYDVEVLATAAGFDMVGAQATTTSDNDITGGTDDDVLVLGTGAQSNDTIIFAGTFGDDTVVNFDMATGGTSEDVIDFTSYLTSLEYNDNASTSDDSQVRIVTTIQDQDDDDLLAANEVTIDSTDYFNATDTWAGLTADLLEDAITNDGDGGVDDYGNLTEGSFDILDGDNSAIREDRLVGTTQESILMIENDQNDGEYKVFQVTSTTDNDNDDNDANDDVTEVTLLGTIDFGDTLAVGGADLDATNVA